MYYYVLLMLLLIVFLLLSMMIKSPFLFSKTCVRFGTLRIPMRTLLL